MAPGEADQRPQMPGGPHPLKSLSETGAEKGPFGAGPLPSVVAPPSYKVLGGNDGWADRSDAALSYDRCHRQFTV